MTKDGKGQPHYPGKKKKRMITYLGSVLFHGLQTENMPPALYSTVVGDWHRVPTLG